MKPATKSIWLARTTTEYYGAFAMVEINHSVLSQVIKRRSVFQTAQALDPEVTDLNFAGGTVKFFDQLAVYLDLPEEMQDEFDDYNWVQLPAELDISSFDQLVPTPLDALWMAISDIGVAWIADITYNNSRITTPALPFQHLGII